MTTSNENDPRLRQGSGVAPIIPAGLASPLDLKVLERMANEFMKAGYGAIAADAIAPASINPSALVPAASPFASDAISSTLVDLQSVSGFGGGAYEPNRVVSLAAEMPAGSRRSQAPQSTSQAVNQGANAFDQVGSASKQVGIPFEQVALALDQSASSFDQAGRALEQSRSAFDQAGRALGQNASDFDQAGRALGHSGSTFDQAGRAFGQSGSTLGQAGSVLGQSGSAFDQSASGTADGYRQSFGFLNEIRSLVPEAEVLAALSPYQTQLSHAQHVEKLKSSQPEWQSAGGAVPLQAGEFLHLPGVSDASVDATNLTNFLSLAGVADRRGSSQQLSEMAGLAGLGNAVPSAATTGTAAGVEAQGAARYLADANNAATKATTGTLPAPSQGGAYNELPASYSSFLVPLSSSNLQPTQGRQGGSNLNVDAIRRDFPILSERVNGHDLIWLDNAATTQKPKAVIDRLSYFYTHENSNIHRSAHELAARSSDAYEQSRESVRRFINASTVSEIIFVRGATEGINLIAQTWGRQNINENDEIVVSHLEHHANIVPWQMLCEEKGAKLRVAPVNDAGEIIVSEFQKLLGPKTKLVSFTHVSNALGTVTPAAQLIELAHRNGARVLLDGAQSISHMPIDVQFYDCDFFVFSGHKVYAPTGIGVVFGKQEILEGMKPWHGGGNMIQDVRFERTIYQNPPARFEAGTGNIADAVGLGAAIDYLERIGMANVARHEHELIRYALEGLKAIPGLHVIGAPVERAGVISFILDGFRNEDVSRALNAQGLAVRSGHHCAQPILRRLGVEGTVRPSFGVYNTCEEVDALVLALANLTYGRFVS